MLSETFWKHKNNIYKENSFLRKVWCIMKKILSVMLAGMLAVGMLAGCSSKSDSGKNDATDGTNETGASVKPVDIVIWHDGNESITSVIEEDLNEALKEDKITVKFEKKTGLTDQLKLYGNDKSNGPDMYFYAHDSLGIFAEMNILAPIDDFVSEDTWGKLLPMTVEAGTYKDQKYLMPAYFETLVFLYNKDRWQGDIPDTTEELYDYMVEHTDENAGTYGMLNQHSTAYNVSPFINGFGASIIDENGEPHLDSAEMKEAVEYDSKFAKYQTSGDYNTVNTIFNEGKADSIWGGPWLIAGIKEAGINYGVKALSDFKLPNGNALKPYSGVQGLAVMKYAADSKKDAISKVLEAMADEKLGIDLANKANCAPAVTSAYDDEEVGKNEMVAAMRKTADEAVPMPNVPQISVMWTPTEGMLSAVNRSGDSVDKAAKDMQENAKIFIENMK